MQPQTPEQFAKWAAGFSAKLGRELAIAETRNLRDLERIAQDFSNGQRSSAQLAAEGHPYGKGFTGARPEPLAEINTQTGAFAAAWHSEAPHTELATGDMVTRLINDSPQAAWLEEGTKWMVARHYSEAIVEKNAPNRQKELDAAIERALPK